MEDGKTKILLRFSSVHFTSDQNIYNHDNPFIIDWDMNFIPNKGDFIDLFDGYDIVESILSSKDYDLLDGQKKERGHLPMLSWHVDFVSYCKYKGNLAVILNVEGE